MSLKKFVEVACDSVIQWNLQIMNTFRQLSLYKEVQVLKTALE